jgi:hypothetical protein
MRFSQSGIESSWSHLLLHAIRDLMLQKALYRLLATFDIQLKGAVVYQTQYLAMAGPVISETRRLGAQRLEAFTHFRQRFLQQGEAHQRFVRTIQRTLATSRRWTQKVIIAPDSAPNREISMRLIHIPHSPNINTAGKPVFNEVLGEETVAKGL